MPRGDGTGPNGQGSGTGRGIGKGGDRGRAGGRGGGFAAGPGGYCVCPKCGERVDLFKAGGGEALAEEMSVPFLGKIPIDREIVTSGDVGKPFVEEDTKAPASTAFADVVSMILRPRDETAQQPKHKRSSII